MVSPLIRKVVCAAIAASALSFSPLVETASASSGGKDLTFEFKVQVSPKSRVAQKNWKTVASYKSKAAADRKAAKVARNHGSLNVRVKQKK